MQPNNTRRLVTIGAIIIAVLMLLWPPKTIVTTNPLGGANIVEQAGYVFLFTDPAAERKAMLSGLTSNVDSFIQSQIDFGKLFVQYAVLGAAAFVLVRVLKPQPRLQSQA